jgi:hypothetical protein
MVDRFGGWESEVCRTVDVGLLAADSHFHLDGLLHVTGVRNLSSVPRTLLDYPCTVQYVRCSLVMPCVLVLFVCFGVGVCGLSFT